MSKTKFKLKGTMHATLINPDGSQETFTKDNLIVEVGYDFIADSIGKPSGRPGVMSHIAIGDGVTAALSTDTELESELARGAATYSHVAGTDTFQFEATFAAGTGTGAITESGVLNASSAGILLDRAVFPVINKGALQVLVQRFVFTMSEA